MSKQMNLRLDEVHEALLVKTVERLKEKGTTKPNKSNTIHRAIYMFADSVLSEQEVKAIIDQHYKGIY